MWPSWHVVAWCRWDGSSLAPDHSPAGLVAVELYSHEDVGIDYSFDAFENVSDLSATRAIDGSLRGVGGASSWPAIALLPFVRQDVF